MYEIKPCFPEDINDLKPRLRKFDKIESKMSGCDKLTDEQFIEMHEELYSIWVDNRVEAVLGISVFGNRLYFCFVGSDEINKNILQVSIRGKYFIKNRAEEFYWAEPTVIIHPQNIDSKKWLKLMGFNDSGWKHRGLEMWTINKKTNLIEKIKEGENV